MLVRPDEAGDQDAVVQQVAAECARSDERILAALAKQERELIDKVADAGSMQRVHAELRELKQQLLDLKDVQWGLASAAESVASPARRGAHATQWPK